MSTKANSCDADDLEDDDNFGISREKFFQSINMEKWAHLFDPFLLSDRDRICLAWLYDATTKNFEQLGISNKDDIEVIRSAIRGELMRMSFDFDDDEEEGILPQKKLSTKSNNPVPTVRERNSVKSRSQKAPPEDTAVVELPVDEGAVDTGLTEFDLFGSRQSRIRDPTLSKGPVLSASPGHATTVDITLDFDPCTLTDTGSRETFSSATTLAFSPLRPLSRELVRGRPLSPAQAKPRVERKDDAKKIFDEQAWGAIAKTRGSIYHKFDKGGSPTALSPVNSPSGGLSPVEDRRHSGGGSRPSSPGSGSPGGRRSIASPTGRPGSPARPRSVGRPGSATRPGSAGRPTTPNGTRKNKGSVDSTVDGITTKMQYGDMVSAFNFLQKQMAHIKSDFLRPFKNEIGCEIANMLLIGPKMVNMYLCIGGKWYIVPSEGSLAGHCAMTGETLNVPEAHTDRRFNIDVDIVTGFITKSILCKPVISRRDKQVIGVVQLINKTKQGDKTAFGVGTDAFSAEDEVACDLFVQNLSREIDENFNGMYVNDVIMGAFVKPITEATRKGNTPQYLKSTTATVMNHAFNRDTESESTERDLYADHQSTMLRLGAAEARMSAQEDRDREVGAYLRGRHHQDRPSSPGGSRYGSSSPRGSPGGSPIKLAKPPPTGLEKNALYPPLFPDYQPKKKEQIFK